MRCECSFCGCKTAPITPLGQNELDSSSPVGLLSPRDWEVKVNDGQSVRSICSGCWDEHYKRTAPVPEKQRYEWANEGMCPSCGIEALSVETVHAANLEDGRPSTKIMRFEQCPNCGMGFARIEVNDYLVVKDELKIKSESIEKVGSKPRRELINRAKANGYQLRYIRSRSDGTTVVCQVGWNNGELDHVDCKVCHNEWRRAEGVNLSERFDVAVVEGQYHIRCKKCLSECSTG